MNILLHMCCGPCACYPVPKLRSEGHDITGYFFNPNIHPYKEFKHRIITSRFLLTRMSHLNPFLTSLCQNILP